MSSTALLMWGILVGTVVLSCFAIRTAWVSSRFAAVTQAQYDYATANSRLATAYSNLTVARLASVNQQQALAAVADAETAVKVAETAVQQAEARLPLGRSSRAYFADKAAP